MIKIKLTEENIKWLLQYRPGIFRADILETKDYARIKEMLLKPEVFGLSLINSNVVNLKFTIIDVVNSIRRDNFRFVGTRLTSALAESLQYTAQNLINIPEERLGRAEEKLTNLVYEEVSHIS